MTITIESGSLGVIYTKDEISQELADKIIAFVDKELKPKIKKVRKPKPTFKDLGNTDDFENDIFDEDGNFCIDAVQELIEDSDYCYWNDNHGEKDNELPFRLLINNKYLVQFSVHRGECVEATWDHRIWDADCVDLELISVDENVKDVEKKVIPVVEEPKPIVLAKDEIMFLDSVTKVLNSYENPFRLKGGGKYWKDDKAHATKAPWVDVELKNGAIVYGVKELQNVIIYKLTEDSEDYYLSPMKNWYEEIK